jgi:hypothetical protein
MFGLITIKVVYIRSNTLDKYLRTGNYRGGCFLITACVVHYHNYYLIMLIVDGLFI